jgi:hypothetical protein
MVYFPDDVFKIIISYLPKRQMHPCAKMIDKYLINNCDFVDYYRYSWWGHNKRMLLYDLFKKIRVNNYYLKKIKCFIEEAGIQVFASVVIKHICVILIILI